MAKVSLPAANHFCPQTLFLFGTYREDGTPNFGLFCWVSYCWDDELCVMACIGEDKLTRDRIRAEGVFSMNLVTKELLPLADFCGNTPGTNPEKKVRTPNTVKGEKLPVPVLADSPWSYELSVKRTVQLDGGGELYVCRIANILADEALADRNATVNERIYRIDPVCTTHQTYFDFSGNQVGVWGDWKGRKKD